MPGLLYIYICIYQDTLFENSLGVPRVSHTSCVVRRHRVGRGRVSSGASCVPGAWHQAPGTRYLVPGTRYLVPGTWYQVPGTWYQSPGTRYQVPGTQVPSTWYQVPGTKYPNSKDSSIKYPSIKYPNSKDSNIKSIASPKFKLQIQLQMRANARKCAQMLQIGLNKMTKKVPRK